VRTAFVTSRLVRSRKWGRALTVGVTGAAAVLAVSFLSAATGAHAQQGSQHDAAPTISKQAFGQADGVGVDRYTLANSHGMTVRILTYGGIIQSVTVPDRKGHLSDVVLGFATTADYVKFNSPAAGGGVYFGALVGRYANRIAKGTFTLDGVTYHVPVNNNGNSLHGGTSGFDQKVWSAKVLHGNGTVSLQLTDVSPNGEEGYPGTLTTVATYTLDNANRLSLGFKATTDAPTVVNLTNHTYWNLAGESSGVIDNQKLQINADRFTPTDSTQIPTGQLEPVRGTAMDFTRPMAIGARINENDPQLLTGQGYDLNWVLNRPNNSTALAVAAKASDPVSGRTLAISTTQPGLQFYSGNFLTGTLVGTSGHAYRQSDGFALETQHFPDSPNEPAFPTTVLRPGQTYHQTTVWQLGAS
jgi:aldose 1-epimerase